MEKPSVLINCSNLHVGGGVAVAASFIDCLSRLPIEDLNVDLLLSAEVAKNLEQLGTGLGAFTRVTVRDFVGLSALWRGVDLELRGYDTIFSVFGPVYSVLSQKNHIMGFAQPDIIYPDNPIDRNLPVLKRRLADFKRSIQCYFYSKADLLIAEIEHVERGMRRLDWFRSHQIRVVYSAVHSVFRDPEAWAPIPQLETTAGLRLGIISRNYPHKNISILPRVKESLKQAFGVEVEFFVTFRPEEWGAMNKHFRDSIRNVGGLTLSQCPTFYRAMHGVIFPSLLECFSAVPLEAMLCKRPLFASDLPFIRDVCGQHCQYFDPHDPDDIARVIVKYFEASDVVRDVLVKQAYLHALSFPTAEARALSNLEIIRQFTSMKPRHA